MSNGTLTQNQQEEVEVMSGGTGGEEASGDELNPNSPQGDEVDDFTENDEGIEYPENSTIRACISSLLTPYLYRCMVEKSDYEVCFLINYSQGEFPANKSCGARRLDQKTVNRKQKV